MIYSEYINKKVKIGMALCRIGGFGIINPRKDISDAKERGVSLL